MHNQGTMLSEHVLERDGCKIHYWLAGPEGRPFVVLTHGAALDHQMFAAQIAPLAKNYRILLWDVRGHGVSQPIGKDFSILKAAADLIALLDTLGVKKAVLVGHSMGGIIAQEVVFHYPERVIALAIVGSECITFGISFLDAWMMMLTTSFLFFNTPESSRLLISCATGIKTQTQIYAYNTLKKISHQNIMTIWQELVSCLHYERDYRISHPLLLTHGEYDNWGNIKQTMPFWAARDSQCRFVIIPLAGHNANQDNPPMFNQVLLDFLHANVPLS